MKKLVLLVAMTISTAFASNTGHIHFQADSTWVNPVNNRSLCFDGTSFRATVVACIGTRQSRGGEECSRYGKKTITQPANSTRLVCVENMGRSGDCRKYSRVAYNQSRDRRVDFEDEGGNVYRSEIVTIPSCN
ncbi:MAG: hypothetical protein K9K67_15185 [Bacteriovoracaceae bacterium]|nr:hypothetical protein [Bacteriovoracaceae bacterium]